LAALPFFPNLCSENPTMELTDDLFYSSSYKRERPSSFPPPLINSLALFFLERRNAPLLVKTHGQFSVLLPPRSWSIFWFFSSPLLVGTVPLSFFFTRSPLLPVPFFSLHTAPPPPPTSLFTVPSPLPPCSRRQLRNGSYPDTPFSPFGDFSFEGDTNVSYSLPCRLRSFLPSSLLAVPSSWELGQTGRSILFFSLHTRHPFSIARSKD